MAQGSSAANHGFGVFLSERPTPSDTCGTHCVPPKPTAVIWSGVRVWVSARAPIMRSNFG